MCGVLREILFDDDSLKVSGCCCKLLLLYSGVLSMCVCAYGAVGKTGVVQEPLKAFYTHPARFEL